MNNRKTFYKNVMKPLSNKKITKYDFIGFDVETYGEDNRFLQGGLYYYVNEKEVYVSFWNKVKMINFIMNNKFFKGKYFVATNLSFDFTTLFYDSPEWNDFKIVNKQSNIILATKTFKDSNKKGCLKFIDTFNYAMFSVQQLGEIIGIKKGDKPEFLGKKVKYEYQKKELEEYNKQDCKISCDFMYFLQKGINESGGKLKVTIASCSLDIWRRNFLDKLLIKENYTTRQNTKEFIFKGYYGGRTEAFNKGMYKDVYYYDVNSLYPSVMCKDYPLPNSIKHIYYPNIYNIKNYMGVSECEIIAPKNINKPLLPFRTKDKLMFPIGNFTGTYNHNELQKALSLGYKVKPLKQIVYTKTWKPFKTFVEYFYAKRLECKNNNSNFEYIYKLILNSLYGKFAQKDVNTWRIIDVKSMNYEETNKAVENKDFEYNEDMSKIIIREKHNFDGVHSFPILSSYVTSYARILMYDYINNDSVIYTDTDSIISKKESYIHSSKLGEMKLEGNFKECFIVRPKFYYYIDYDGNSNVKIKGLNKASLNDFIKILDGNSIKKMKFSKIKESFRRGISFNKIMTIDKSFILEDNKRNWIETNNEKDFKNKLFDSVPLEVTN